MPFAAPVVSTTPTIAPAPLRLAMLGMIAGNGHPFSWSSIINGYDPTALARCPYPGIIAYMSPHASTTVGIPGARVTHVWTDDPAEASAVAATALIPHVVKTPEDVIGHVDAVFIATDDGFDHVRRARPFIEAGLPVFVDKPLATSVEDLRTFIAWEKAGARILSSSGLRYAPELDAHLGDQSGLGQLRWVSSVTAKTWERYGIHALEPVFRLIGPGFTSVRLESAPGLEIAHLTHRSGTQVTLPVIYDGAASFGTVHLCGMAGQATVRFTDTYTTFRRQLVAFVEFLQAGRSAYPFSDTVELMAVVIAGLRSRAEGSRRVDVSEILASLSV